jgi:hypothetical protein
MKHLVFFLLLTFSSITLFAQENFTVDGKNYELKTEVKGEINLLWNVINKQYRYFIKTADGHVTELLNTKDTNHNYQEQYKTQLSELTKNSGISTSEVKFTLQDLKEFIKTYNVSVGNTYDDIKKSLKLRLGLFGGITNQPFVSNPNNTTVPFFGAEFEGLSSSNASRHAGFLCIIHALDNNDFEYSSTQLALGYRYRFINKPNFNVYGNMQFATYTFSKQTFRFNGLPNETIKESNFQVPCSFGLGADIKVNNNSFITLSYNDIFGVFINNSSNFPVDFALGYKFCL